VPVPFFQDIMLPLLEAIADGQEHQLRSVRQKMAPRFGLTENDLQGKTPSGANNLFANRVAWASTHLKRASLLESPKHGFVQISDEGKKILQPLAVLSRSRSIRFKTDQLTFFAA
jgi:restriction system protein